MMRPEEKTGARSEARFLSIFESRTEQTPKWFVEIKRAPWRWEMHGIDAFAYILSKRTSSETDSVLIRIPIQIKSSYAGKAQFARKYSEEHVKNILVYVMEASKSDEYLRKGLYTALGTIRNQRLNFDDFLLKIRGEKISRHKEKRAKKLSSRLRHFKSRN